MASDDPPRRGTTAAPFSPFPITYWRDCYDLVPIRPDGRPVVVPPLTAADEIKLNQPFEGKFPDMPVEADGPKGPRAKAYRASLEVTLETGHKPTVAVTAAGDGRKVAITVLDKDGTPVATNMMVRKAQGPAALRNWKDAGLNEYTMAAGGYGGNRLTASAKVEVPAVPVTDKYTIVIFSNNKGEFTLTVEDPKAKK